MNSDEAEKLKAFVETWGSRSEAVKLPFDMNMQLYLLAKMRVPRLIFQDQGLVYHYTDDAGLFGIVGSGRFWATNSVFLNDPTEFSHALTVARKVLGERNPSEKEEGEFIRGALVKLGQPRDIDLYVVSFCRDGNLLSQWRGYGAFGKGYSLGFDLSSLRPHPQMAWLLEVIYDDDFLASVISDVLDVYAEHIQTNGGRHIDDLASWCAATTNFIALGFKHCSYEEEKEVRLLFRRARSSHLASRSVELSGVPVSYRPKGGNIISYLDTGLQFADRSDVGPTLPLKKIFVGPGTSFAQNERSILGFLASKGYESVDVVPSMIPFRL